jgi:HAE1 family hydrophobic/amphiphilic exporter-1
MQFFGLTLNFLSLFALVLSLGLLVDDAILIVEAFHKYSATKKFSYREAMLLVLRDYKWVDISTTLVIACFFASMMFMTGIIGRFMFSFPFVITITLLASLVCSLTIVPALTIAFQR